MMGEPSIPPEIPYPFPPGREPPRRSEPVMVPMVEVPSSEPSRRLFERRTILLSGPLDRAGVMQLCAQLMALDGRSEQDVELIINSTGGPPAEISAALDVIDVMRGRVNTTCVGTAQGTAAVLLVCGTGSRRAGRHAAHLAAAAVRGARHRHGDRADPESRRARHAARPAPGGGRVGDGPTRRRHRARDGGGRPARRSRGQGPRARRRRRRAAPARSASGLTAGRRRHRRRGTGSST